MTELYLGGAHYDALVGRVTMVAGAGDIDQIKAALGPLANDRPALVSCLAHLAPCPVSGEMTDNQVKIALGENGDTWPRSIMGDVAYADMEEAAKQRVAQ